MNADARLVAAHEFFRKGEASAEGWSLLIAKGRGWESSYRGRWRHDKVVRSTHGVNCTGSCSWNVYVKDGLITWESQAVDYPRTGPDLPEYEPRGCPRGASFSWYTYSPARLKYPVRPRQPARAVRAPRATGVAGPGRGVRARSRRTARYRGERGRGGFVRCDWEEASELIAAATVHAIREHGPDRVGGFTPIPAMSPVSFAAGTPLPVADRRAHDDVLRLVRGPAARVAAGVRRPDRRAGVGRLVGRELPDRVGHQPADHAHAGRALHDRGALPRPEGRRRLARLLRSREVRRRLAARAAGHRRRRWRWRWAT